MNIVEKERKRQGSCNFCDRGVLNHSHTGLDYPYDKVFLLSAKSGLTITLCEDCLNEIKIFTPSAKFKHQTYKPMNTEKDQYEKDLAERQRQHLENILGYKKGNWRPCMHDQCTSCYGTGIKHDGSMCVHCISCPCPKCTSSY